MMHPASGLPSSEWPTRLQGLPMPPSSGYAFRQALFADESRRTSRNRETPGRSQAAARAATRGPSLCRRSCWYGSQSGAKSPNHPTPSKEWQIFSRCSYRPRSRAYQFQMNRILNSENSLNSTSPSKHVLQNASRFETGVLSILSLPLPSPQCFRSQFSPTHRAPAQPLAKRTSRFTPKPSTNSFHSDTELGCPIDPCVLLSARVGSIYATSGRPDGTRNAGLSSYVANLAFGIFTPA